MPLDLSGIPDTYRIELRSSYFRKDVFNKIEVRIYVKAPIYNSNEFKISVSDFRTRIRLLGYNESYLDRHIFAPEKAQDDVRLIRIIIS